MTVSRQGVGALTVLGSTLALNSGITANNNIDLHAKLTIDVATGIGVLSGIISQTGGPFSITKTGAGALILTGANSYTGATTVTAGDLTIGSGAIQGAILGAVTNNATLRFINANTAGLMSIANAAGATTFFHSTTTAGAANIANAGQLMVPVTATTRSSPAYIRRRRPTPRSAMCGA